MTIKTAHIIILAGRRPGPDPVADPAGVPFKGLVEIAGTPMIERVIGAVTASNRASRMTILAQDKAAFAHLTSDTIDVYESSGSISQSILDCLQAIDHDWPVMITTADHALLTADMITQFLDKASTQQDDLNAAFVASKTLLSAYPESIRTFLKFSDEWYSGCNMFLLRSVKTYDTLRFWKSIEQDRKNITKMIWKIGPVALLLYLIKRLSLESGIARLGKALGCQARPIVIDIPEACIDVDKPSDISHVEDILSNQS